MFSGAHEAINHMVKKFHVLIQEELPRLTNQKKKKKPNKTKQNKKKLPNLIPREIWNSPRIHLNIR